MSPLLSLISLALVGMTVGCTSLPTWNGKYTRTDGKFELHSELEADMIEVAIVRPKSSSSESHSVKTRFLAKVEGNLAKEMQLCRQGLCAKECLSTVRRTAQGLTYEPCNEDIAAGTYR